MTTEPHKDLPDIASNRAARKYSRRENVMRVAWALFQPIFRLTPRPLWGLRRAQLRLFGATVGEGAHIYPSAIIAMPWNITFGKNCTVGWGVRLYALGPMRIGDNATISQYAHLCGGTHDWSEPARPLIKTPIEICDGAWICTEAFVGPAVTVGRGAIVGARAVVMRDVSTQSTVAGNPAQILQHPEGSVKLYIKTSSAKGPKSTNHS